VERATEDLAEASKYAAIRPEILTTVAVVFARRGSHAQCAAPPDELATRAAGGSKQMFCAAGSLSMCVAIVDEAPIKDRYAARATDLLRRAAEKGIKQASRLQLDPALESVRDRVDFPKHAAANTRSVE